jgi:S1-C subfamily serine protease
MTNLEEQQEISARLPSGKWSLGLAVVLTATLALGLLTLYVAPILAVHWRRAEDEAAADALYLRRQAELRAESEDAEHRLINLDRRFKLVSLGFREVARKIAPVVVHIGNETEAQGPRVGRFFYDFDEKRHYVEHAEGSGIVAGPGYVLTNHHVVKKAQRLHITFASGKGIVAGPGDVSSDPLTDLAVIRLPRDAAADLKSDPSLIAEFADSDKDVQVGDWVLAAGSPFGLRQSLTAGIISAKGRAELHILDQVELLQTDAAINPGNSGGPLFEQLGRVVGINFAIASENGHNEGVGFAIPSNTVKEVVAELLAKGEVTRGFLGILMQELPDGIGSRLGLDQTGGVLVSHVEQGSPADAAGLRQRDILVRFNQEPVGRANALTRLRQRIARVAPGTSVQLEVLREGRHLEMEATLAKRGSPD